LHWKHVRGQVVLAVEGGPLFLMLAIGMIRDPGFEPLWASNADEASIAHKAAAMPELC
jgi:hypothetical protein